MGSPLFDIRKSHLLITELLTNFGRKTEELNRLKTSIDAAWNDIRKEKQFSGLGQLETSSTLAEISKKSVAICIIGQSYEAKCKIVNDIFSLKGKNLIARKSSVSPRADRHHFPDLKPCDIKRSRSFSGVVIDETGQESPEIDLKDFKANIKSESQFPEDDSNILDECLYNLFNDDVFEHAEGSRHSSSESSSEDEANTFRARLDSQGRMMRFQYGIDHKVDQDDLIGSLRVMNATQIYKQNKTSALIDQEKLQNAMKFNKDDCCEITIAHPILEAATIIVSPSLPSLFDSKEIVSTITSKSLPFFIYAVQKFPLTPAEKQELQDLKRLLPLAAILFVKVESEQEDYSSLHGREKVCCHHMLHQVHQKKIRSRIGSGGGDGLIGPKIKRASSNCFTCSFDNSQFFRWLKDVGLHGTGHWTERANRCMFLESSKRLHEYIVPFIRRQSRAYLLASITGMQEYLDKLMKQLVGHAYQLSTNAVTLPSRIEYITTSVEKIKTSRLSVSMERITELFSLTISKGKLELMDNSSEMTRSLSRLFYHEVDYNHIFDENLSNNEKARILKLAVSRVDSFVLDWISRQFIAELGDLINPVDNEVLLRLITKLQNLVPTSWGRLETSPKELLAELIRININFKATDGLSWSSIAKRKLGKKGNVSLFFSFDYDWRFKYASNLLCELSPTLLSQKFVAGLKEKALCDYETFLHAFLVLEQRLLNLINEDTNQKIRIQNRLIPNVSRVLLEVTSYRDGIMNRMPQFKKELGRGQFGVVYSTDTEWERRDKKMEIAIKAMVPENDRQWADMAQEYFYMNYWITQRHNNILHVLGVLIDQNYGHEEAPMTQVLLVLERCNYDLHTALKTQKYNYSNRIRLAGEIANGLRCLHSYGLIHRDIKLKNILIDQYHVAKISDMGFCRPDSLTDGSIVGTPIHMPPEIFNGQYANTVDIYAFGILLWYMVKNTIMIPRNFEDCPSKEHLWRQVARGKRPEKIHCDSEIWDLMTRSWSHDPLDRPSAGTICFELDAIRKNIRDSPERALS